MANPEKIDRAYFQIEGSSEKVDVHFNPESLEYTITNNMKNQGGGNSTKQYVSDSTGKLKMDLIFDNTANGEDIRLKTVQIAKLMEPSGSGKNKAPPVVNFEWGLYKFKGMLVTYKETIDYFSSNGVPLRASINISMSSQDSVFEGGSNAKNAATSGSAGLPSFSVPATSAPNGKGATGLATQVGDPSAAKYISSSNGVENMRFPGSTSFELDASTSLKGPAGFASVGFGVGGGIGLSAGAGMGLSVGAGASAGIGASAGAFSGLQANMSSGASSNLKLDKLTAPNVPAGLGISAGIGIGGSAGLQGSASMTAEVGQSGELESKLEFDGA